MAPRRFDSVLWIISQPFQLLDTVACRIRHRVLIVRQVLENRQDQLAHGLDTVRRLQFHEVAFRIFNEIPFETIQNF
jgi:hypothetical protein